MLRRAPTGRFRRRMPVAILFATASALPVAVGLAFGCGGSSPHDVSVASGSGTDASGEAAAVVPTGEQAKQTGRIIRAQSTDGVEGATVTVGTTSAATRPTGEYELEVPKGVPYQMTVTADGFFKLLEQEWILKKDTLARGDTNLLITQTANLLANFLPDRKKEKGIVVVRIEVLAPCTTEDGSTLTIEPAGEAKVAYFSGNFPSPSQRAVQGGTLFSGVFYNVDVGVPVKVGVTSPTCAAVPFPFDVDDVTYTGNNKAEPDESLSYHRVYLRELLSPIRDAGAD
jgi:hypothetical protein